MGRKRIDVKEVKVPLTITIKRKYFDALKENNINASKIVTDYVKKNIKY